MAQWTIPFCSLAGTDYEIVIDGMASARTLTGGPSPIVIDEDDTDYFFEPVRTQTGEVTFWDATGGLWRELMPAMAGNNKVELYKKDDNTRTMIWQGYLAPATYSGSFVPEAKNRTIAVYCPLSHAEGQFMEYDATGDKGFHEDSYYGRTAPSVAWYLWKILSMSGGTWRNIYLQTGHAYMEWLNVRLNYDIFFEQGEAAYSNLEVLRHLCQFFGWQLRQHGQDLYFLSATDADTAQGGIEAFTMQELLMLAKYNLDPQPQVVPTGAYIDLEDYTGYFANLRQEEQAQPGWNRCTVRSSVDKVASVLAFPTAAIEDAARTVEVYGPIGLGTGWMYYKDFREADNQFEADGSVLDILGFDASYITGYLEIRDESTNTESSVPPKRNYNWSSPYLRIPYSNPSVVSQGVAVLWSTLGYGFASGIFVISAAIWEDVFTSNNRHNVYPANGTIRMKFRVGDKYWNGTAWVTEDVFFDVAIGNADTSVTTGQGQILNTRLLNDPYPAYDGYGIPVPASIAGIVELTIGTVVLDEGHGTANQSGVRMNNIEVKFLQLNTVPLFNDDDENTADVINGTTFTEEVRIEIPFTAYKGNSFGRAIAMQGYSGYCDVLHYGAGSSENPNQHVAETIAAFGRVGRMCAQLELLGSKLPEYTPMTVLRAHGDTEYGLVSRSWDWYEDILKIKVLETNTY